MTGQGFPYKQLVHENPRLAISKIVCVRPLIPDPLHILQEHLLTATVIKFRGSTVGVAGDPLSGFKVSVPEISANVS